LINGLAIFAGAGLGGWLSVHLPPMFGYPLLSLFLVSSVGRLLVHLLLGEKFQEVRAEVRHLSSRQLFFSVMGLAPMIGQNTETTVISPATDFSPKPRV
jgi:uncharacterized membrane protein YfcA